MHRTEAAVDSRLARDSIARGAQISLEISELTLTYGDVTALRGINLVVNKGEFVALLGPSGCGKTSLLRSVAGFVHPQRGRIRLGGRDVADLPPRQRNIGLVFQSYALFPHMTVMENVRFGLECRRIPRQEASRRVQQALALVGLATFADRRPKQLSGGQQQRVALARALVIEPDLLLLDEPLGALDKQLRVQMQTELKALQKRVGVTAVFVTHDQEEAMSIADRIAVMRDGIIQQIDTPERLFANPATAWVCDFVSAGNLLRGPLVSGDDGRLRLDLGHGASLMTNETTALRDAAVFVPAARVRLEQLAQNDGLTVTARRFLGLAVEIQIATTCGTIFTQVSPQDATPFQIGSPVQVVIAPEDCRLLPDR